MNLVQLGANVGNDHVQKFIEEYKKFNKIVLVEPIDKCLPILAENYIDIKNVSIEPSVIKSDPNVPFGKVDFYLVDYPEYKPKGDNFEVSSLSENHTKQKGHSWEKYGKKIELDFLNFEALTNKYDLKNIDFLFTDIEGEDEKVLHNIDLSKYDFKIVLWEINSTPLSNELMLKFKNLGFELIQIGQNLAAYKKEYESYIQNIRQWLR